MLAWGLLAAAPPATARAQLLSPGRLASPHAELEGLRSCTECHQLGTRGIAPERCLDCHEPLDARIRADLGYHATIASQDCADCHQDHLGEGFDLVRLDDASFDHAVTGYPLELGHRTPACRDCHRPEHIVDGPVRSWMETRDGLRRTFLGLSTDCASCHRPDDPHDGQFGDRGCDDCHDEGAWRRPTAFDHAATAFPLLGRHAGVECASCHARDGDGVRYRPLASDACADCHAPSPHGQAMRGDCGSCHVPAGWGVLTRGSVQGGFDHDRTAFTLRGAHAAADCTSCHGPRAGAGNDLLSISFQPGSRGSAYPRPVARGCSSCHVDRHAFPRSTAGRWLACASCHAEETWTPTSFDLERHEMTALPLTGAHVTTPCVACHVDSGGDHTRFLLAVTGRGCADCHQVADDHQSGYGAVECEACHVTGSFDRVAFDHAALDGEGAGQAVGAAGCTSCHAPDDPHAGQFQGRDCASCHGTASFAIASFDHALTRFPLEGAHADTTCVDCHRQTEGGFVRYRPLGTACTDCHGDPV